MLPLVLLVALATAPMSPQDIEERIDAGQLEVARAAIESTELTPVARETLEGRLALAENKPNEAAQHFADAVQLAPGHPPLRLLWAHALLRANRPELVESALAPLDPNDASTAGLLAAAFEARELPGRAYDVLARSADANPSDDDTKRALILLCARAGLLDATRVWIETLTPQQLGHTMALAVLQEIRSDAHALPLARLLASAFPDNGEVQTQLGWVASTAGATAEASRAFARATALGEDAGYVAAEHARAAGRYDDALRWNRTVRRQARREGQRFDILFESGKLARAIAAAEGLSLSSRQQYNLAYAHYGLTQYAEAAAQARKLSGTEYEARGQALLRAMGR